MTGFLNQTNDPVLVVYLARLDLDNLKQIYTLATSKWSTMVAITNLTVQDMNANYVVPIYASAPLSVSNYTRDSVPPYLQSWDLDMNAATLTLHFSETVNVSSLNAPALTLQSAANSSLFYELTGGYSSSKNNSKIVINVTKTDMDSIKAILFLTTMKANSFLSFTSILISDMAGNLVVPVASEYAIQATVYTNDTTRPFLVAFRLDMNQGTLAFTFSETVNVNSFNPSQIRLQAYTNTTVAAFNSLSLTGGTSSVLNSTMIQLSMSITDLNALKVQYLTATAIYNTYIVHTAALVQDMAANAVVPLLNGFAQQVANFTPDTTRPQLVSWTLDMNTGNLSLTYNETVNKNSLMAPQFTLQDASPPTLASSTLSDSSTPSQNNTQIDILLSKADLNQIKALPLCTFALQETDCYLSLSGTSLYVPDTTSPTVNSFAQFDRNTGLVTIIFSETVNVSTFDPTQITLVASVFVIAGVTPLYQLTGHSGIVTMGPNTTVSFYLSFYDLNRIKQNTLLCASSQLLNCYIMYTYTLVYDQSTNPVVAVNATNLYPNLISSTIAMGMLNGDITPPQLLNFSIDMDQTNITFTFSETINHMLSFTSLTFINGPNGTAQYTLTGGLNASTVDWIYTSFYLIPGDVKVLKYTDGLAFNMSTTYITLTASFARDTSANQIVPIYATFPLKAWSYKPDVTPPKLVAVSLDLQNRYLSLTFNEPVRVSPVLYPGITVQSAKNATSLAVNRVTLTGGSTVYTEVTKTVLFVSLNQVDMRLIRIMPTYLGSVPYNLFYPQYSYISILNGTVLDIAGNGLTAVPLSSGSNLTSVAPDLYPAQVLYFNVDLNLGTLTLFYDDVVKNDTLHPQQLTVLNISSSPGSTMYTLTGGSTPSPPDYVTVLVFSMADLNEIKRLHAQLFTNVNNTFILLTSNFISDIEPRQVFPVTVPMQATGFIPDTNLPSLISFTLNMNLGLLLLTFNETVKTNTLNVTQITIQSDGNRTLVPVYSMANVTTLVNISSGNSTNATVTVNVTNTVVTTAYMYDPSVLSYTLTGGFHVTNVDSIYVTLNISKFDLDQLKLLYGLAISQSTTFLTFPNTLLLDMSGNQIVPSPTSAAQEASDFIPDRTSPSVVLWNLDVNTGTITLSFSETINATSIDVTQLRIQSQKNSTIGYSLTGGSHSLQNGLLATVWITTPDLNAIKSITKIATYINNTYLSLGSGLVRDMSRNTANSILTTNALQVTNFTMDTTPPVLVSYNLDMNSDLLSLTFSETVNASSIVYSAFTLLSHPNSTDSFGVHTLTCGTSSTLYSTVVNLTFCKVDSDTIRRLYDLARAENSTFLSITTRAMQDMNRNPVVAINTTVPEEVTLYKSDFTPPWLVSFNINLSSNQLTLTFSETINILTFMVEDIMLQSSNISSSVFYFLTGGSYAIANSTVITINLTVTDLNQIKRMATLAVGANSTYISFSSSLVEDMFENMIVPISYNSSLQVRNYTKDSVRPVLGSFNLDLTSETLILFFSETVNTLSLNVSQITLQSSAVATNYTKSYILSSTSSHTATPFNDVVTVNLGLQDLNNLKSIRGLAENLNNTFISITNTTVLDMKVNPVVEITSNNAQQVGIFKRDSVSPAVKSFDLDVNTGTLTLNFSETIDILSLNISKLTLQSTLTADNITTKSYTLMQGNLPLLSSTSSSDWYIVVIKVGETDLNTIKQIKELAKNATWTYLAVPADFVSDRAGNPVAPVPKNASMNVRVYTPDTTGPILRAFSLNLTSELLVLTFDETVSAGTLNLTRLVLLSANSSTASNLSAGVLSYRFTSASNVSQSDSPVLPIALASVDLDDIKLLRGLATALNNTYLLSEVKAVYDTALPPNPGQQITRLASTFGYDTVPPVLLSFAVNINSGTITLNFDEPVDTSTMKPAGLVLQGSVSYIHMNEQQQLSPSTTSSSPNGLSVVLNFTISDLNLLKANPMLYTSMANSYLAVDRSFIRDMAGNPVQAILDGTALQASAYQSDATMPQLVMYSLDMNTGTLNFTFSETVNATSLQFSQLTLQRSSNVTWSLYSYTLTGGSLLSYPYQPMISFAINPTDLNTLKARRIANSLNTTWLVFPITALQSMSNQPVSALLNGVNAARVNQYTPDTTKPQLLAFSLNLTSGALWMSFSETVSVLTLQTTSLTLQSSSSYPTGLLQLNTYTLTSGSSSNSSDAPTITINLSWNDLNAVKARPPITTSIFASIAASLVQDTVGNAVVAITQQNALPGTVYLETTPPTLQMFDINFSTQQLTLYFSETVDVGTFDITQLTLVPQYSSAALPVDSYTFTGGVVQSSYAPTFVVQLTTPDFNALKLIYTLATSRNNTYLSITSQAIQNMAGIDVVPIPITGAQKVSSYTPDAFYPSVVQFDLDMNGGGSMTLYFSETINSQSLNVTQIKIQNAAIARVSYQLQSSFTLSPNGTSILLNFTAQDLNAIKQLTPTMATSVLNSYISISSGTIQDMSSNPVSPILSGNGLRATTFTPDTTPPQLLSFALDLNSGVVDLTFSETVLASSFNPRYVTFSNPSGLQTFTLTGGAVSMANSTQITLVLSADDLNGIKQFNDLATIVGNSLITVTELLVTDMARIPVLPVGLLQARNYVADTTPPLIRAFVADMNTGMLLLSFSEYVNTSLFQVNNFKIQSCNFIFYNNSNDSSFVNESNETIPSNETTYVPVPAYQYTLTGGVCMALGRTFYSCQLTTYDLNQIKALPLCTYNKNGTNCDLVFTGGAILDRALNPLAPVFDGCGLSPTAFIPDTNRPSLVEFTNFNLNTSMVTLTFNETVNSSSIDLTKVTFQSFYRNPALKYTLTGGAILSSYSTMVEFELSIHDLLMLQVDLRLCSDITNCWISLGYGFIRDMAENVALVVPPSNAVVSMSFVHDSMPPELVDFTLDLTNNTLTLTFSKIVRASSLNPTAITLLSADSVAATAVTLTGGYTSSPNGLVIVVNLLTADLNAVKALKTLATGYNDTYISITSSLITDVATPDPNWVVPIPFFDALDVGTFIPDAVRPRLLYFDLDMNSDVVTLSFDEPVRVSTLQYSSITLLSNPSNAPIDSRVLVGGDITAATNYNGTLTVSIHMTQADTRYLKLSTRMATSRYNSYMSILQDTIQDMAGNGVVGIRQNLSLPVRYFTPDSTPANLIAFSMDMNTGTLHLTFNDIMNASTLYPNTITIQAARVLDPNYVTLTASSFTASPNGYYIDVNISAADLNAIKLNTNLSTSSQNTFLSMRAEAFRDVFAKNVIGVVTYNALQASGFISDHSSPVLRSFSLDMNTGTMALTFDETVSARTAVVTEIVLQGGSNVSNSVYLQLRAGSSSQVDSTVILFYVAPGDLNVIKQMTRMATSVSNTFIAFSSALIKDMNNNSVVPINTRGAMQASAFTPDTNRPQLVAFSIDLTARELLLTFNETVNASSLHIDQFSIQGVALRLPETQYQILSDSTSSVTDSTVLMIYLQFNDFTTIRRLTSMATSINNTFIAATAVAVSDMSRNALVPISTSAALQASNFTDDSVPPALVAYSLNMSSEVLTLTFTETVRISTFDAILLTLSSSSPLTKTSQSYTLSGGIIMQDNSYIVSLILILPDLNEIKRILPLAVSANTTFLTALNGTVRDMSGNPSLPVQLLKVSVFAEDLVPPSLESFNLDLNTGVLTLMFSETVNTSSLDVTQITFQNLANLSGASVPTTFALTNASFATSNNSATIVVQIAPTDLNSLKQLYTLASSVLTTYIAITQGLIADMNKNPVIPIPSTSALLVSVYVYDRNPPSLQQFDLNINTSQLVLRFNETVNRQSLYTAAITLQSSRNTSGPLNTFTLTAHSSSLSSNSTSVTVDIGAVDLNNLKKLTAVATSINNTYLSLNYSAIADMQGNAVVQIPGTNALQVTTFVRNTVLPRLIAFSFDANAGIVVLTFTETVMASSLNVSAVTLQSGAVLVPGNGYILIPGTRPQRTGTNSTDGPVLTVLLGIQDLNAIKAVPALAKSINSTFLSANSSAIMDMAGLSLVPIPITSALQASQYTADTTPPVLLAFSLNMSSGVLQLTFDETVNVNSLNVTQVIVQSGPLLTPASSFVQLSGLGSVSAANSTLVSLVLSHDDLNQIKLLTALATSPNNTFLQLLPRAVFDMAIPPNYVQGTTLQIQPQAYTPNLVSPVLLSFSVDVNQGLVELNFDEVVRASSLNVTGITLLAAVPAYYYSFSTNATSLNATNSTLVNSTSNTTVTAKLVLRSPVANYTLTGGSTNSSNGQRIIVILTIDDLNNIRKLPPLLTSNDTSFISVLSTTISDMNSNPVVPIVLGSALHVTTFISDTTPPILVGFDLDMNKGVLVLSFPEVVDVYTTMYPNITLQKASNVTSTTNLYMLTNGSLVVMADDTTASIQITLGDLNELKRRRIALTMDTSWLLISADTILDTSHLGVIGLVSARMVTRYIPDTTPPQVQSFTLDMNNGQLTLFFSETVDTFMFNVTSITFQDTAAGSNAYSHYALTQNSYVNSSAFPIISVVLGLQDTNAIKALVVLAKSVNSTFLSITSDMARDMSGNQVTPINGTSALRASKLIPDTSSPSLLAFSLDMDAGVLTLSFSETVNPATLNVSSVYLISGQNLTFQSYQLTNDSTTNSTFGPTIEISLSTADLNAIKVLTGLATQSSNTYLYAQPSAIKDASGNPLNSVSPVQALQVLNYTQDTTDPALVAFDLNVNAVLLTLVFSESVNVSSLDVTNIRVMSSPGILSKFFVPTAGTILSSNGPTVAIKLVKVDADNLKAIIGLAVSPNTTYLSIRWSLVNDMAGNSVNNISISYPLQVRYFIPDTTPPYLDHFDLDLNSNVLSLVFSKTVNASTLKMGGITLQSYVSINNATVSYTLTNGVFMTIDRPVIQIQLTTFDSNQLRSLPILTKSSNTTYISMTSGTIYDMVSLPLVPVNSSSAQKVNNFTSDTSSPSLTQFSINLSQETLTLNFSETVQISSFDATQVTLFYGNISYTLSGGAVLNQTNTPNVTLTLTTTDLNMIKFLYPLATGMNATYIAITMLGVTDVFGNPLIPVPALVASGFVADMVAPRLLSFGLDMNLGTLTITFSETVNTSSLSASGITLQSSANTTIGPFVLSSTSFSPSPNGTVVQVNISAVDLNALKQLTYLALNSSTVFLSLNPGTVLDMSGNPVVAIPASSALPASMYVRDMTRPQLVSFVLDRNVGVLTLTFSETVNATLINVTGLSLQSSSTSNLDSVPLTGGVASNISSYIITITLLSSDLNLIKSHAGLATSVNNTYITSTSLLVSDMFTNPLIPIITANALEAYLVVADRTSPTLKAYDLDMNAGTITFFFSESVNASTFDPTQLTLQNAQTATAYTTNYTLTGFLQPVPDINNIKMMVAMTTSQNTTYLSLTSGFIQDQSGNPIVNISTAAGSQVQKYTPDTSCPSLDAFQLDLNVGLLLLTFNEPVNSRVLNVTGITVQNLKMAPSVKYTLTGGNLNCSQYTVVVVLVLSKL
ncbi:hypothetical protein EMCRGX_G018704 [Ephydatia muelleri]